MALFEHWDLNFIIALDSQASELDVLILALLALRVYKVCKQADDE